MDPTGPTARRFPLIARPRPPRTALPARINALAELADRAARDADPTAASRVHNQAALIASDCGQPDLARTWCHRHARAWLDHSPLHPTHPRHALEPLVNLARLRIRAGDSDGGFTLVDTLYHAVRTRTDTTIDGLDVPTATLTRTTESHQTLSRWLWSVHLADGTRALTTAGHWLDAEHHLQQHNGIGTRILDGRQVAIIARTTTGQHPTALRMLAETEPGEPWETAVTACLTALSQPPGQPPTSAHRDAMISTYHQLEPDPTLVAFTTRLALSIIDSDKDRRTQEAIARHAIDAALAADDGYAARDLLSHDRATTMLRPEQNNALTYVVRRSGLNQPLPSSATQLLDSALPTAERVITNSRHSLPQRIRLTTPTQRQLP